MAVAEPDDQPATAHPPQEMSEWWHFFQWFVHDLRGPLTHLYYLSDYLDHGRPRPDLGRDPSLPHWDHFARHLNDCLVSLRSYCSVATTLAFHRHLHSSEEPKEVSLVSLLQDAMHRDLDTYGDSPLQDQIHVDDSLLASPPILIRTRPAETVLSHLLHFARAVTSGDTPIRASAGNTALEMQLTVHVRAPGLDQEDVEYIWAAPDRFFKGHYPTRLFRDTGRRWEHSDFSACLAVPAALLVAPSVPCDIRPELQGGDQLVILVSFGRGCTL